MGDDTAQLVLNRTWRPALSVTGVAGAPAPRDAGNVLRPFTELKLSLRVPPSRAKKASARLKEILERDPPYGARVTLRAKRRFGLERPATAPWLEAALEDASMSLGASRWR